MRKENHEAWGTAKQKLINNLDKYNLCVEDKNTLAKIKDIFTSNQKVDNEVLRMLWLKTNKQSSLLWKEVNACSTKKDKKQRYMHEKKGLWEDERQQALNSLNEYGYYILKKRINVNNIDKLNKRLRTHLVRPSNSYQQMLETNNAGEIIDSNEYEYVRWHFESNNFSEIEELKNLASDKLKSKMII